MKNLRRPQVMDVGGMWVLVIAIAIANGVAFPSWELPPDYFPLYVFLTKCSFVASCIVTAAWMFAPQTRNSSVGYIVGIGLAIAPAIVCMLILVSVSVFSTIS